MENLFKNYDQVIQATENCIQNHMPIPSLILIYSVIDSASWIASNNPNEGVGAHFKKWVDRWMLKNDKIQCSAEEIYAARCGILHTLTPDSHLSQNKGVRRIAYTWGKASNEKLEESISKLSMENHIVSVHLEDLFRAFKRGFTDYLEYVFSDEKEKAKFLEKSGQHFSNLEMEQMDQFLEISRKTKV